MCSSCRTGDAGCMGHGSNMSPGGGGRRNGLGRDKDSDILLEVMEGRLAMGERALLGFECRMFEGVGKWGWRGEPNWLKGLFGVLKMTVSGYEKGTQVLCSAESRVWQGWKCCSLVGAGSHRVRGR